MDGGVRCLLSPSPAKSGLRIWVWWRKAARFWSSPIPSPLTPAHWWWLSRSPRKFAGYGEVPLGKPRWLPKISAVNVQGLASFDPGKLARRLGTLSAEQYSGVKVALRDLLLL